MRTRPICVVTTRPLCSSYGRWLRRAIRTPRSISRTCTSTAMAFRRTTQNRCKGTLVAADQGSADAQIALVFLYEYGEAVPQDYVQAQSGSNLLVLACTATP